MSSNRIIQSTAAAAVLSRFNQITDVECARPLLPWLAATAVTSQDMHERRSCTAHAPVATRRLRVSLQ